MPQLRAGFFFTFDCLMNYGDYYFLPLTYYQIFLQTVLHVGMPWKFLLACGIEIGLLSIFDAYTVEQKKSIKIRYSWLRLFLSLDVPCHVMETVFFQKNFKNTLWVLGDYQILLCVYRNTDNLIVTFGK